MSQFRTIGSLNDTADQIIEDFKRGIRHKYYVAQGKGAQYYSIIGIAKGEYIVLYNPFLHHKGNRPDDTPIFPSPIEIIIWLPFTPIHQISVKSMPTFADYEDIAKSILHEGKRHHFEDGVSTPFSKALVATVVAMPEILPVMQRYFENTSLADIYGSLEVASEAMRWIGSIEDRDNWSIRRELLESFLLHPSARVRDGAALGLASMDDPAAIPALEDAIEREVIKSLKKDLKQVLDQLVETKAEQEQKENGNGNHEI